MLVDSNKINYNISVDRNIDMEIVIDMLKKNILLANDNIQDVKLLSRKVININKNSN